MPMMYCIGSLPEGADTLTCTASQICCFLQPNAALSHHALQLLECEPLFCSVVSKGAVVEDGSHFQLLEAGGVYSSLVRRQMQRNISTASFGSLAHAESSASLRDLAMRK